MMKINTQKLVEISVYASLFIVLDYLGNFSPIKMPNGGSFEISVIVLILASYRMGYKYGLFVSLLALPLMFLTTSVYLYAFGQYVLDYVIGYGVYGLSAFVPNLKLSKTYSLPIGALIASVIRFASSTLSGVLYFGVGWRASISYQITYMLPTSILAVVVVGLVLAKIDQN